MLYLTIRTDKPEAEIGLLEDAHQLAYRNWQAHRQLAETIHTELKKLLDAHGRKLQEISGIIVYEGPGSFTGLRIGVSVANALAASLGIPLAGAGGSDWLAVGCTKITESPSAQIVPVYGAEARTTQQKK